MLQMFIALTSWFIFFMIIEQMGERPLAISNIIRNAYMILMIPLMGFGSATNTLVSTLIGEKKYNQVFVMIKKISIMSFVISLIVMLILNIMPEIMLGIFTNNDELIQASIPSLRVIDGSLLMYSVSTIVLSAVSGSGNTLMSLIIEIVTIIFYLFATYLVRALIILMAGFLLARLIAASIGKIVARKSTFQQSQIVRKMAFYLPLS